MRAISEKSQEPSPSKTRVQFDFSPSMVELLDRLVQETEAATRAELVRRALSVYAILWDESKRGKDVVLFDKKGGGKERLIIV